MKLPARVVIALIFAVFYHRFVRETKVITNETMMDCPLQISMMLNQSVHQHHQPQQKILLPQQTMETTTTTKSSTCPRLSCPPQTGSRPTFLQIENYLWQPGQKHIPEQFEITIWTVPREFEGDIGERQFSAIQSWLLLRPKPKVVLLGSENGVKDASFRLGCSHYPNLPKTRYGTVLLDKAFALAKKHTETDILVYVNSDIFFSQQWMTILQSTLYLLKDSPDEILIVGPRVLVKRGHVFDHSKHKWDSFWDHIKKGGKSYSNLQSMENAAQDYFVYKKGSMQWIPPFHIGRYVWDNHIVAGSRRRSYLRINGWNEQMPSDPLFFGLHFEHDRSHQKDKGHSRLRSYNEKLSKKDGGWGGGLLVDFRYFLGRCDDHPEIVCLKRTRNYKTWVDGGKRLKLVPYKRASDHSIRLAPPQPQ